MANDIIYHYTSNNSAFHIFQPVDEIPQNYLLNEINGILTAANIDPKVVLQDEVYSRIKNDVLSKSVDSKIINIRASSAIHLNDSSELKYGIELFRKYLQSRTIRTDTICFQLRKKIEDDKFIEFLKENTYLLSFSSLKNNLNQWRLYGNDGKGICIGIDKNKIPANIETSLLIGINNVEYLNKSIFRLFDENSNYLLDLSQAPFDMVSKIYKSDMSEFLSDFSSTVFLLKFLQVVCCVKHPCFNPEKEIRLVMNPLLSSYLISLNDIKKTFDNYKEEYKNSNNKFFLKNEEIINYHDIPFPLDSIKEIWLGPKNPNTEIIYRKVLNSYGLFNVKITKSKLPYK